jgi:hypothetical protein
MTSDSDRFVKFMLVASVVLFVVGYGGWAIIFCLLAALVTLF